MTVFIAVSFCWSDSNPATLLILVSSDPKYLAYTLDGPYGLFPMGPDLMAAASIRSHNVDMNVKKASLFIFSASNHGSISALP